MASAKTTRCPGRGCAVQVPKSRLFCRSHWFALPKPLRDRIYQHYKPGQTLLTASPEYLSALREAIGLLKGPKEGGPSGG